MCSVLIKSYFRYGTCCLLARTTRMQYLVLRAVFRRNCSPRSLPVPYGYCLILRPGTIVVFCVVPERKRGERYTVQIFFL